jgi:hypothetical protein
MLNSSLLSAETETSLFVAMLDREPEKSVDFSKLQEENVNASVYQPPLGAAVVIHSQDTAVTVGQMIALK